MSEQSPQPQPDILTEAQGYDSLDSWLTQIPDERLQQIVEVVGQVEKEDVKDEDALARLIGVAMYFSGNQPMKVEEVTNAFHALSAQIGLEAYVRNGIMVKDGKYSMHPDGNNAKFMVTEKGREMYGGGGEK